jgi:hypothetical protein
MVLKVREILIGQRTALINAVRGHAAESASSPVCFARLMDEAHFTARNWKYR